MSSSSSLLLLFSPPNNRKNWLPPEREEEAYKYIKAGLIFFHSVVTNEWVIFFDMNRPLECWTRGRFRLAAIVFPPILNGIFRAGGRFGSVLNGKLHEIPFFFVLEKKTRPAPSTALSVRSASWTMAAALTKEMENDWHQNNTVCCWGTLPSFSSSSDLMTVNCNSFFFPGPVTPKRLCLTLKLFWSVCAHFTNG